MRLFGFFLLAVAPWAALSVASDASAQTAARRGFWVEATAGTGTVRNTCAGCAGVTVAFGPTSSLRVGGALTDRVLIGVELFSMYSSEFVLAEGAKPVDAENGSLAPVVIWYVGRSGFFLKGGAGLASGTFTVRSESGEAVTTERTGSGLTFGLGFDIAVMRWFNLTANVGSYVTAIGDVFVDGTVIDDVIATVYEAGVGLTFR